MSLLSHLKYYYLKNHYFKKFNRLIKINRYDAVACQQKTFQYLVKNAANTAFGKEHRFNQVSSYEDFKKNVPVRDYEDFIPYINRVFNKEQDVLWPGTPLYFGKSSGTVSGAKYIPITREYLQSTRFAARYMIANLIAVLKNTAFLGKKVFYQADAQVFEMKNGFKCASVSAIKSYRMPRWAKKYAVPAKEIAMIADIKLKLQKTIDTIQGNEIRMAVALPVWLLHFLQEFEKRTGKKFKASFPSFTILFVSGMNYEPYESLVRQHMGSDITLLENYTATEGNFAYQVQPGKKGMELICNQGIFYEFIPLEEFENNNFKRLQLKEVTTGRQYILVISSNTGLWAYRMNDIVAFISLDPFTITVSGRLHDIFSPFGEHLLPVQAEQSIAASCQKTAATAVDFFIVPCFDDTNGHHYICYIEFYTAPENMESFSRQLHQELSERNHYYGEFNRAAVLLPPVIIPLKKNFFSNWLMLHTGKNSAQQKIKHLISRPELATTLIRFNE